MARVLVNGASGFIGRHLIPALLSAGYAVDPVTRDAGDVSDAATWRALAPVDAVVHLAGRSYVPDSWAEPAEFVRTNVLGTVQALEFCRTHNARLVFLSSYLYGNPERLPVAETAPIVTPNPYALSKKLAEDACAFYAASFGVPVSILRPFNVYGPGQPAHFLLQTIIRQLDTGDVVKVMDLGPRRDFVYVDDLVQAIIRALASDRTFRVYNIGSGESHSVADVISLVQEARGTDVRVESAGERRKDEIMDTIADITRAADELGWRPQWTLRDGVRQTISFGRDG